MLTVVFCICFFGRSICLADENMPIAMDFTDVKGDYADFYLDKGNLFALGIGIGTAGIFANTSADSDVHKLITL